MGDVVDEVELLFPHPSDGLPNPQHPTLVCRAPPCAVPSTHDGTGPTTQRGIMAAPFPALLRSRGRPSPLHRSRGKGSALPRDPTERGGPPPLVGLSPGLCGPGGTVAYFTHRTVRYPDWRRGAHEIIGQIGGTCIDEEQRARASTARSARSGSVVGERSCETGMVPGGSGVSVSLIPPTCQQESRP